MVDVLISFVPRLLPSFLSHTVQYVVFDKKLGRSLGMRLVLISSPDTHCEKHSFIGASLSEPQSEQLQLTASVIDRVTVVP